MDEESKTENETVIDQESRTGDSEVSSSSSETDEQIIIETDDNLMAAPTTGSEPAEALPEFRNSVLSASALVVDDTEQDSGKNIDE